MSGTSKQMLLEAISPAPSNMPMSSLTSTPYLNTKNTLNDDHIPTQPTLLFVSKAVYKELLIAGPISKCKDFNHLEASLSRRDLVDTLALTTALFNELAPNHYGIPNAYTGKPRTPNTFLYNYIRTDGPSKYPLAKYEKEVDHLLSSPSLQQILSTSTAPCSEDTIYYEVVSDIGITVVVCYEHLLVKPLYRQLVIDILSGLKTATDPIRITQDQWCELPSASQSILAGYATHLFKQAS